MFLVNTGICPSLEKKSPRPTSASLRTLGSNWTLRGAETASVAFSITRATVRFELRFAVIEGGRKRTPALPVGFGGSGVAAAGVSVGGAVAGGAVAGGAVAGGAVAGGVAVLVAVGTPAGGVAGLAAGGLAAGGFAAGGFAAAGAGASSRRGVLDAGVSLGRRP